MRPCQQLPKCPCSANEFKTMRAETEAWNASADRRRSLRVPLHWTVYLTCHGVPHPLRSTTENLSRGGFYCCVTDPLTPGEHIQCDIVVPTHASQNPEAILFLRCCAQVLRVELLAHGYGLACRIDDFSVLQRTRDGKKLAARAAETCTLN